jgi:Tfp pilus assembly protein PilO
MKNYRSYIFILFALCALVIFVFLLPRHRVLTSLNKNILEKEIELRSQEQYVKELKEVANTLKENKDVLSKIESALPKDHSLPELLNFFQKAASQAGIILGKINPHSGTPEKDTNIMTTQVDLNLDGNYSDFKDFLRILEKSARLIEVNNIHFAYPRKQGPFNFNISTEVYSY